MLQLSRRGVIVLGFSGGPDAAALAHHLKIVGCNVVPVYVDYRLIRNSCKTVKDLRHAHFAAHSLGLRELTVVRESLGDIPKSQRNQHLIRVLASVAREHNSHTVALGTLSKGGDEDLDPKILSKVGMCNGVQVVTWDTFNVRTKAEEFMHIGPKARRAIFATTSCQIWWKTECGKCKSCKARHEAFMTAFGHDPTEYNPNSALGKKHAAKGEKVA